jgi:paraquat-inducible protein B
MDKAEAIFGRHAFRKIESREGYRFPINKALFEVWSVSLMDHSKPTLVKAKEAIMDRYISLLRTDYQFLKSISQATGSIASVQRRFATIETLLAETVR